MSLIPESVTPYWISAHVRPVRVALLLDVKVAPDENLDRLIEWALWHLGGRFFPIVAFQGDDLTADDWRFLSEYDPDIVVCRSRLPRALIEEVRRRLAPAQMSVDGPIDCNPATIDAQRDRLSYIRPNRRDQQLCTFFTECEVRQNLPLERFLRRNFGQVRPRPPQAASQVEETYRIGTPEDLVTAVARLQLPASPQVFPSELAATVRACGDAAWSAERDTFAVAVGDSVGDALLAWNHALHCSPNADRVVSLWVPTAVLAVSEMAERLAEAVGRLARMAFGYECRATLMSTSVPPDVLEERFSTLLKNVPRRDNPRHDGNRWPTIERASSGVREDRQDHRGLMSREAVDLRAPEAWGVSAAQAWAADMLIEHHPDTNIVRGYYWRFPPDRTITDFLFPQQRARISPLTRRPTLVLNGPSPAVVVALQRPEDVFAALLREWPPNNTGGRKFSETQLSDKGRYTRNLIELFGSFGTAARFFEKRMWRAVVDELPEVLDPRVGWPVTDLISRAKREFEAFRNEHGKGGEAHKFDADGFDGTLADLLGRRILVMGADTRCPYCESCAWRPLNELDQSVQCPGCRRAHVLSPRTKLAVKLNSLVKRAAEHDVIPVLLTLGELSFGAGESFAYQPQTEVFLPSHRNGPLTDIDVLALVDGKLVIGEVKTHAAGFRDKDFEMIRECTTRLRPDRVLFAALNGSPGPDVLAGIKAVSEQLESQGLPRVEWFRFPSSIYEASPHN